MELGRHRGAVHLQRVIAPDNATQVALDIVRIVVIVTALVVAVTALVDVQDALVRALVAVMVAVVADQDVVRDAEVVAEIAIMLAEHAHHAKGIVQHRVNLLVVDNALADALAGVTEVALLHVKKNYPMGMMQLVTDATAPVVIRHVILHVNNTAVEHATVIAIQIVIAPTKRHMSAILLT